MSAKVRCFVMAVSEARYQPTSMSDDDYGRKDNEQMVIITRACMQVPVVGASPAPSQVG
jgi:hypothetical protein